MNRGWVVAGMAAVAVMVLAAMAQAVEDPRLLPRVGDGVQRETARGAVSLLDDRGKVSAPLRVRSAGASSPIVTPITVIAGNTWDYQHDDDGTRQIARLGGTNLTHFVTTYWDVVPEPGFPEGWIRSYVHYNAWEGGDVGILTLGSTGDNVSVCTQVVAPFSGYGRLDLSTGDLAQPTLQMRSEPQQPNGFFSSWIIDQGFAGLAVWNCVEIPGSVADESIRPSIAVDRGGSATKAPGDDVYHVIAYSFLSGGRMNYWRRIGIVGSWAGPVCLDESPFVSHHPAVDATSERVSVAYARDVENLGGLVDVVYLTSANNGQDWIDAGIANPGVCVGPLVNGGRQNITNYADGNGPQSWTEITSEYDFAGNYHVIWVEQAVANVSSDCRIRHWSDATGTISTVAGGMGFGNVGGDGVRDLWLAYPQMGFGDGSTLCTDGPANPGPAGATSNLDYLYVTYEQYGGPTSSEANDVSDSGFMNLEVYLGVSNDGGATWARPVNLTNTKTPGCDGTPGNPCYSERDPSIAKLVDDTIHVLYIEDHDAGDAVFGQGTWTYNSVQYLRIPGGTDAAVICPEIAPVVGSKLTDADTACAYHAPPGGSVSEELVISNLGNAPLTGTLWVVQPAGWFQVTTGEFTIPPGGTDMRTVVMDASVPPLSMTEGVYTNTIRFTHNDPGEGSPVDIPVVFNVYRYWCCDSACACVCPGQGDFDFEGTITSVDLAAEIDVVFFGAADIQDPMCPRTRGDFDANGITDAVDLALLIDHVFFGASGPVNPCL